MTQLEHMQQQVIYKEEEIRLIITALNALADITSHGWRSGIAQEVIDDMCASSMPLNRRLRQVEQWLQDIRSQHNH